MKRTSLVRSALGLAAVAITATVVSSGPAGARPQQAAASAASAGGGGEYVVAFADGREAAVQRAVRRAGGTIIDVNESANLALVNAGAKALRQIRRAAVVDAVVRNHAVATARPGMPHRFAQERPTKKMRARYEAERPAGRKGNGRRVEPLAHLQWDMEMIGATPDGAHQTATGKGVTVGIIDTGVDASHPDLEKRFDHRLSRNFTMDIPAIDGPCEVPTCIDPPDVDEGGHGTHVAGSVAADRNRLGISGVAPDAKIVNLRAGQDSGYFFVYETVAALTYAGDNGIDVANMSFYTDPWLYNCASRDDYISGEVTDQQIEEQAFVRSTVLAAVEYAHDHGVTLVGSAGNSHFNLALDERPDATSPDYPPGTEADRVVTSNCLDLPSEGPQVISVSAVGPSTTKADYSNYGWLADDEVVEVSAPGGWFRDGIGTPTFQTPGNLILSSYPLELAIEEGLANPDGTPTDDFSVQDCDSRGRCAFYTYLQGTSMASPHVTGVAALVIEAHGEWTGRRGGYAMDPDEVRSIIESTATDHACPAGGIEIYTDEGRPPEFNAICDGTTADNGLYGEGIVDAVAAVE
jgi:subtilisin family serine protease